MRLNREHGTTVLVSLHQPELALAFCPRIVVLDNGSVIYDGPAGGIEPRQLYRYADNSARKDMPDGERADASPTSV
jgi:phosphonate transport system ATP-binding protein